LRNRERANEKISGDGGIPLIPRLLVLRALAGPSLPAQDLRPDERSCKQHESQMAEREELRMRVDSMGPEAFLER
jgi:hypothetical protein